MSLIVYIVLDIEIFVLVLHTRKDIRTCEPLPEPRECTIKLFNISDRTCEKGPCRASFQNRVITTIGKSRL